MAEFDIDCPRLPTLNGHVVSSPGSVVCGERERYTRTYVIQTPPVASVPSIQVPPVVGHRADISRSLTCNPRQPYQDPERERERERESTLSTSTLYDLNLAVLDTAG